MFILGGDQLNKYLLVSCPVSPSIPLPRPRGGECYVVMIARTFYYRDNKAAAATITSLIHISIYNLELTPGYVRGGSFSGKKRSNQ